MGNLTYQNYYELLGVPRTATKAEIRHAYKELVLKHDPNRTEVIQSDAITRTELLMELTRAFRKLSNDKDREAYDRTLRPEVPRWNNEEQGDFPRFKPREPVGFRTMSTGPGSYFAQKEGVESDLEISSLAPDSQESRGLRSVSEVLRRKTFWKRLVPDLIAKIRGEHKKY